MNRITRKTISKVLISIIGLIVIFGATQIAMASDPVGVYALVDKVVFEPNDSAPERMQIWGTFIVSAAEYGSVYGQPARGYLYFSLPSGKEQLAKTEWADLKKIAGTGQAIAFGSRYQQMKTHARVRKASDKPDSPDVYPTGIGLTKLDDSNYQVKALKSVSASR